MTLDSECWSGSSVLIRGGICIAECVPVLVAICEAVAVAPAPVPPYPDVAGLARFGEALSGLFVW